MIEGVTASQLGIGSGWALVCIFVIMVLRGDLVPRRTYNDGLRDRDEWRAAHRISETARQVAADQVEELLEHARTTDALIQALPRPEAHP